MLCVSSLLKAENLQDDTDKSSEMGDASSSAEESEVFDTAGDGDSSATMETDSNEEFRNLEALPLEKVPRRERRTGFIFMLVPFLSKKWRIMHDLC
jgi:hypothetical protein